MRTVAAYLALGAVWGSSFLFINTALPFTLIAGLWLRDETITAPRAVGLVLGFAGAGLLASREFGTQGGDPLALLGAALVAAAAVSYAFGASYAKRRIRSVRPHVAAAFGVFFATLYTWPVALIADGFALPRTFEAIVSILWLGFLGSFVAYLLYFGLIERLGATRASTVAYLFPVVGVALGVTLLQESMDWRLIAGLGMVLGGIVLANLRSRRASQAATDRSGTVRATT